MSSDQFLCCLWGCVWIIVQLEDPNMSHFKISNRVSHLLILYRFTAGLTLYTLKVYVAAISAYHIPLGGMSLGRDPLVSRFLHGTLRLRPAARTRVPTWDLTIVLQGLSLAPFEPLDEFLTLKALFLLAISSLKRIGDLQALSVVPSCLEICTRHG